MLSILFEILTSDDMQDDTSDMLRVFFEVLINGWNWAKKLLFFLAYFDNIFCLNSLIPYELRPKVLPNEKPH